MDFKKKAEKLYNTTQSCELNLDDHSDNCFIGDHIEQALEEVADGVREECLQAWKRGYVVSESNYLLLGGPYPQVIDEKSLIKEFDEKAQRLMNEVSIFNDNGESK